MRFSHSHIQSSYCNAAQSATLQAPDHHLQPKPLIFIFTNHHLASAAVHDGLSLLCFSALFQVNFFSSMDLPYHAISDSEAEELADELTAVLLSIGERTKASDIKNANKATASNVDASV